MLRRFLSRVSRQPWLRKVAMGLPPVRWAAWHFVAGEDLEAGLAAVRRFNARGITTTLNLLGTHVADASAAIAFADGVVESLERIQAEGLESEVSIKLTQIGLDVGEDLCRTQLTRILDRSAKLDIFVRIDMEESAYVERTLDLFEEMEDRYGSQKVGIVIQSYLRNRSADLDRLLDRGSAVRLVKGGYWEDADIVYQRRAEIDAAFERDIRRLLRRGRHPAIATQDPEAIRLIRAEERELGLERSSFVIEQLYRVRPDLQAALVRAGYRVRIYVPYGDQWFAFFLGCLRRVPGGVVGLLAEKARRRPLVG